MTPAGRQKVPSASEQMPGWLERIDDPWGLSWRAANTLRRLSLRRAVRFLAAYARGVDYDRPVFVIGAPRSGTTMLYQLLHASRALTGLPGEGHNMWRRFHHPRRTGWRSDVVTADEAWPGERRFIAAYIYAHAIHRPEARRFVEKTPENSLRIPYLRALFPDAVFVVIQRDPCSVINSLIAGWHHPRGRFRSYFLPQSLAIPDYPHRHQWCFVLIDGWRDYVCRPIPEIAFAQWAQCVRAIAAARDVVPETQWLEVPLEGLLAAPEATATRIYEHIGIEDEPAVMATLRELVARPVNALTPPGAEKWRRQNEATIMALLPRIADLGPTSGYRVDPDTGRAEPWS